MNLFLDAFAWIFDPARFTGTTTLQLLIGQHLLYSLLAFLLACAIGVPLGWLVGHTGRGRDVAVALSGAARALPSFGLILLFVQLFGFRNVNVSVVVAFVLLAVPAILAGAYAGIEAIDRRTIDAARAVGMTEWQILWRVEVPLGLPLLVAGMRNGLLQIVATATLAGYVGLGALGLPILQGIANRQYDQVLGASIVVIALAIVLDTLLGILQRGVVPQGVREQPRTRRSRRAAPSARPSPAGVGG